MDLTGRGAANTSGNKGIWPSADPGNAKATGYDSEGATLGFTKIPYKARANVERQPPDLGLFTGRRRTNSRNPPAARSRGSRLEVLGRVAGLRRERGERVPTLSLRRLVERADVGHFETVSVADLAVREGSDKMIAEEEQMKKLPEKYRARIREEEKLVALLKRAHAEHDAHLV